MIVNIDSIVPLVLLAALVLFIHIVVRRRWSLVMASAVLSMTTAWWLFICWIYRDGMGPESVESSGLSALAAFMSIAWPYVIAYCVLIGMCIFVVRRGLVLR